MHTSEEADPLSTHIRPLLRFQSHAQPDLFTSNPSLLHHFQGSGVSNSLVAAQNAQAASGSSGAAGGAGRSGYSGASGGYTGHARAFLSLPQGPAADATSVSGSAEEKKDAARQRARLAIKQQQAARREEGKQTRVVMVRDRISSQAGSRPVKLIDVEPEESTKRPSITYPAWAALPADAAPGGALWLPGAAPRPLGARPFSTRVTRPQLTSSTPVPEAARIDQPNHVFMDLAGLDFRSPSPTQTRVRRNSTASVVRSSDDAIPPPVQAQPDSNELDQRIYGLIANYVENGRKDDLETLINYYRSERGETTKYRYERFSTLELPTGYTVETYNACIWGLLETRARGQSIAPILSIYNEMLERDIVPNLRTTALVVRSLCLREADVAAASHRWQLDSKWKAFKREQLGLEVVETEADRNAAAAIEAYQNENNLQSAVKLYTVAAAFYPTKELELASDIIEAAGASASQPQAIAFDKVLPAVKSFLNAEAPVVDVFSSLFQLLGAQKDQLDLMRTAWQKYRTTQAYTSATTPTNDAEAEAQKKAQDDIVQRDVTSAAIAAFVASGDVATATEIAQSDAGSKRTNIVAMIQALCEAGDADGALAVYNKLGNGEVAHITAVFDLADSLIKAGRHNEGVTILCDNIKRIAVDSPGKRVDRMRTLNTYGLTLAHAAALDGEARVLALKSARRLLAVAGPRYEGDVVRFHADLLNSAGLYDQVPELLERFGNHRPQSPDFNLQQIVIDLCASTASIKTVLQTVRTCARLGQSLANTPVPQAVIDKYMASRLVEERKQLLNDNLFRLLECLNAVPIESLDMAVVDAFVQDAGAQRISRPTSKQIFTPAAAASFADRLLERFGREDAINLLSVAVGDEAAALLPPVDMPATPVAPEFTLPPTPHSVAPPSANQPSSAHTLHISRDLDNMIERLDFPSSNPSTGSVYAAVRDRISRANEVPSPDGISRLIGALARSGDEPKARELYSLAQVVLAGCVPEPAAQAEAWCTVENAMIAACCFLGKLEEAGLHRSRIIDAGMAPSADAYANMIASSRDSTDDALVARELFDESQSLGVVPHLYLYNTIISKLSKARKADMALELFTRMKLSGIRPSSVTYGAVINACCRVGDAESAATLFDEMVRQRNFKPRVPPFNTMMQLHLQTTRSREQVLHYYDLMRKYGVSPSVHTYKLLLDAYGTLAPIDTDSLSRVFAELCADRRLHVQGSHWASIITAYGLHNGDLDRAIAIFDSIPTHPSNKNGAAPESVVWEAILNAVGQIGTLEQLVSLHERLSASGVQCTAYVCNVLINGYARHGELERARAVFEGMGDSVTGVAAPNNHPTLVTASGHLKPSTTTTTPTPVVFREPSTYEAMIRAEMQSGNRPAAQAILRRMEERRYPVAVWMKACALIDMDPQFEVSTEDVNGTTTA